MIKMRTRRKRVFALAADRVLSAGAPLLNTGRRGASALPANPRVLVVRCDHIGDAAMATTVLGPLRDQLGASRLDVLAGPWTEELFVNHAAVDSVLTYATPWWLDARGAPPAEQREAWRALPGTIARIRREQYDIGIDLRGDLRQIFFFLALGGCRERVSTDRTGGRALLTRGWEFDATRHELAKNAAIVRLLGVTVPPDAACTPTPPLNPPLAAEIGAVGENGYIALSIQGNQPSRRWPLVHAVEFARLAASELGCGVVYIGGPADREAGDAVCAVAAPNAVNVAGRTSLAMTTAILAGARALVTIDSGPMHLAGLTQTPVVALFGAGDVRQFGPWSPKRVVVTPRVACSCPLALQCRRTDDGRGMCMESILPNDVVAALADLLAESEAAPETAPTSPHRPAIIAGRSSSPSAT